MTSCVWHTSCIAPLNVGNGCLVAVAGRLTVTFAACGAGVNCHCGAADNAWHAGAAVEHCSRRAARAVAEPAIAVRRRRCCRYAARVPSAAAQLTARACTASTCGSQRTHSVGPLVCARDRRKQRRAVDVTRPRRRWVVCERTCGPVSGAWLMLPSHHGTTLTFVSR